jgi:MFS-type transporter involved in bile tolerance (Atg22 family)
MLREASHKYPQIIKYLIAWGLYICGANAFVGLATVYMLDELGIGGFQATVLIATVLIFTVPGALLTGRLRRVAGNLKRANCIVVFAWLVVICTVPLLLQGEPTTTLKDKYNVSIVKEEDSLGPDCAADDAFDLSELSDDEKFTRAPKAFTSLVIWVEAVIWGLLIGLIYPLNTALMAEIIPGGNEAAWFGVKVFASKALSWAPPLLYTAVNELKDSKTAILVMIPFVLFGFILSLTLDLDKARDDIRDTMHLRHGNAALEAELGDAGMVSKIGAVAPTVVAELEKEEEEDRAEEEDRRNSMNA